MKRNEQGERYSALKIFRHIDRLEELRLNEVVAPVTVRLKPTMYTDIRETAARCKSRGMEIALISY